MTSKNLKWPRRKSTWASNEIVINVGTSKIIKKWILSALHESRLMTHWYCRYGRDMTFGLLPNTRRVISVISKKRVWSRQEMKILISIKGQIVPILNRVDTRESRSRNLWTGTVYSTDQTSAEKDIESLGSSVSSLSDRTYRRRTGFWITPDKKIDYWDRIFLTIRKESGQRTESRQTESGQQTDNGQDFPENLDQNEDRTRTVLSAEVLYRYFTVRLSRI